MMKALFFILTYIQFFIAEKSNRPNIMLLYIESIKDVIEILQPNHIVRPFLPNLSKLVGDSIKFHNVYGDIGSSSNFASLFTGRSAVDLGLIRGKLLPFNSFPSLASTGGLKEEEETIADVLHENGYRTWFTGYWKLGLGTDGTKFPTEHGFDTWMGVAHPQNEWCQREINFPDVNGKAHPYVTLLYKTSFIWMLVFLLLISLMWFKFISSKLFINLLIYTFCTSFAFYVLLQLFIIQRSASCVLYYHKELYQQPYEMKNLTLHFTKHAVKLMNLMFHGKTVVPFFLVLNYVKMSSPLFHSDFFRIKSTDTYTSALYELDWSIGVIMDTIKELDIENNTVVILTGSSTCNDGRNTLKNDLVYEVHGNEKFVMKNDTGYTNWGNCFKIPLYIKDVNAYSSNITYNIYDAVPLEHLYHTIQEIAEVGSDDTKEKSFVRLYKEESTDLTHMYKVIEKVESITNETNNDSMFQEQPVKVLDWIIESDDEDVTVEALSDGKSSKSKKKVISYRAEEILFHYYDVQKPLMITYRGKFEVIYATLDYYNNLQKLAYPVIVDLTNETNQILNPTEKYTHLQKIYKNISDLLSSHLSARENKNRWSSQFEMPVYPWLLPCANFPLCKTQDSFHEDFSDIMKHDLDT